MASKTFNGARAIVQVDGETVGIFDSCSYSVNIGAEPIHILGRFSPDEIAVTSYEAVQVQCSGFRVINHGVHKLPKFPKLEDLLNISGTIKLSLTDRAGEAENPIMEVANCVPVSYSTNNQAKATSRFQITYMGTKAYDEEGAQEESGASTLI